MDKKFLIKNLLPEDLKGFEDFIEGESADSDFPTRANKKEASFEHFTFLTNDSIRLRKLKDLLMDKIPFASRYEQGVKLITGQQRELIQLKKNLFEICNRPDSSYRKSVGEIFDSFFRPPKI